MQTRLATQLRRQAAALWLSPKYLKDGEKVADEILAILCGKVSDITEASARMLVQESAAPFRMIFKNAQTIKAIMELTGKTQADEVEITEGDGENDNNK